MDKLLYEFLVICFYGLCFVFLPILVAIFLLINYQLSYLISNGILYVFSILLVVWVGLAITLLFSLFVNIIYLKIVPEENKIDDEYVGIVVTTNKLRLDRYFFIYFSDIMLLI